MTIKSASVETIKEAAEILRSGGIVGMPTETVYGLAANAFDGEAVARIFDAKGRPAINPLIVHIKDAAAAGELVVMNDYAKTLADHFWPGPLTMILPKLERSEISELVSAGLPTLAVRAPRHKVTQNLLKVAGIPLAAPSANLSGSLSPTSPIHVADSLGERVDMILAAGPSEVGLESTVVDLSGDIPVILRPGAILAADIGEVLGIEVAHDFGDGEDCNERGAVKSPGQLLRHYAPDTPLRLNAVDVGESEALLAFGGEKFMGLKSGGFSKDMPDDLRRNLSEEGDLHQAAARLFAMLKELDKAGADCIAVMPIPDEGLGVAINDRLKRAAMAHDVNEHGAG